MELAKIAGMGDGLAAGWAELSEDKRRLAEAKQALAQANMPEDGKVRKKLKLNVGGTLFKNVKRETLCIVPESNLAKLLKAYRDVKCFDDMIELIAIRKTQFDDDDAGATPMPATWDR